MRITEVTRRRLIEGLTERRTVWSWVLNEAEFLGRLYDLGALPSTDPRFGSADADIYQGEHHDAELAYGALMIAVAVRGLAVLGVIMHTDQGSRRSTPRCTSGPPASGFPSLSP